MKKSKKGLMFKITLFCAVGGIALLFIWGDINMYFPESFQDSMQIVIPLVILGIITFMFLSFLCSRSRTKNKSSIDVKEELMQAAKNSDLEKVEELLSEGTDLESTDEFGRTALAWASYCGHALDKEESFICPSCNTPINPAFVNPPPVHKKMLPVYINLNDWKISSWKTILLGVYLIYTLALFAITLILQIALYAEGAETDSQVIAGYILLITFGRLLTIICLFGWLRMKKWGIIGSSVFLLAELIFLHNIVALLLLLYALYALLFRWRFFD